MTYRNPNCRDAGIEHGHGTSQVPARPFIWGPSILPTLLRHRQMLLKIEAVMIGMAIPGDGR